jgi:3-hydroxyanthranilate 3,4-dioxygenase
MASMSTTSRPVSAKPAKVSQAKSGGSAATPGSRGLSRPINLQAWIEEHRSLLKVPSGGKIVWEDHDFLVKVLGGPVHRKDYHINPTEELFFQVEGDIAVRVVDGKGRRQEVIVRAGEMFLLPAGVPHAPQRPAGTVGLVVERRRPRGEVDRVRFHCDKCSQTVFEDEFESTTDVDEALGDVLDSFWDDATLRTCQYCGAVVQPPSGQVVVPGRGQETPLLIDEPQGSPAKPVGKGRRPGAGKR